MDARALIPASAAVIFIVFLVWKMWPSVRGPFTRKRAIDPKLAALRARAAGAEGSVRAVALCEAGAISLQSARQTAAFGYYLRAARADGGAGEPIRGIARALERKPRSLERVLWRHLASVEVRSAAARATLEELVELYAHTRDRTRAQAIERLITLLPVATTEPPRQAPIDKVDSQGASAGGDEDATG